MKIIQLNGKSSNEKYKVIIVNEAIPCDITIIGEEQSYNLQINHEDVRKFARQLEISVEDYTSVLLGIINSTLAGSFVDLQRNEFVFYKSRDIKYFFKLVQRVSYVETLQVATDHLFQENESQQTEMCEVRKHNEELFKENTELKEQLDNVIDSANSHESDLYSCLIQVLNVKKKCIKLLKLHLNKAEYKNAKESYATKQFADISDSESTDYNTDDENEKTAQRMQPPVRRKRKRDKPTNMPSTSRCKTNKSNKSSDESESQLDNAFNYESSEDNDESLDIVALPPRITTKSIDKEMNLHPNTSCDDRKSDVIEKISENIAVSTQIGKEESQILDTPLITYSTQDLLDGI